MPVTKGADTPAEVGAADLQARPSLEWNDSRTKVLSARCSVALVILL